MSSRVVRAGDAVTDRYSSSSSSELEFELMLRKFLASLVLSSLNLLLVCC